MKRFRTDERGQDVIEFALLASIIAVAGALLMPGIAQKIGDALTNGNTEVYDAWVPNDPL